MNRGLNLLAGICFPLLVVGMIVSLRSYWGATHASLPMSQNVYRLTADEAGIYLSRFPRSMSDATPPIPRTFDFSGRVQFFHRRSRSGLVDAHLFHIPYWFFWAMVTPPVLRWLLQKKRARLRASRAVKHLCAACG